MPQPLASQRAEQAAGERTSGGIGHSRAAHTQAGDDYGSKWCFFMWIPIVICFLLMAYIIRARTYKYVYVLCQPGLLIFIVLLFQPFR